MVATVSSIALPSQTTAAVGINSQINYQGRLLNAAGATVADGFYNIQFKIYQNGTGTAAGNPGGTLVWTEDYVYATNAPDSRVRVKNGYFSVSLGSICPLAGGTCTASTGNAQTNTGVDFNQDTLFLSVNIGNTSTAASFAGAAGDGEMLPMKRLAANPYAINSGRLGGLTAGNFVQLAQGVQTDTSTTASSIFVNKTGSTANILQLQRGGTDVLLIDNAGLVTFRPNTDNATALKVVNAANTEQVLAVDTTARSASGGNLVKIGNSTGTDSATTILQVDSTTADPTTNLAALNGGLFYNSTNSTLNVVTGGAVAVVCTTVPSTCSATYSPSGASVILNQTSLQSSSNFNISGTGVAATSFNTPLLTTTTGNLTIDPAGETIIRGSVATSASGSLNIQNSASTSILFARNDGFVGIGTTAPTAFLNVQGANQATAGGAALQTLQVTGGTGGIGTTGAAGAIGGTGGAGSVLVTQAGQGGTGGTGGAGGATQAGGSGGTAATGANSTIVAGTGGTGGAGGAGGTSATGGNGSAGAIGGNFVINSGTGGAGGAGGQSGTLSTGGNGGNGSNGGNIVLQAGAGGAGGAAGAINGAGSTAGTAGTAGTFGNIVLQGNGGKVGIGTSGTPSQLFSVGGTTGNLTIDTSGNLATTGTYNTNIFTSTQLGFSGANPTVTATTANANLFIQANGTGTLNLGNTATANTIQIGNNTGAVTQTISIGTNATASSVTNTTIGSTIGASALTLQSGTGNIILGSGTLQRAATALTIDLTSASASTLTITNSGAGAGSLSTESGYQIGGVAAAGNFLRGDGTNFVSSAILASDIPGGSGSYIQNQTSLQASSNFRISGTGVADTSLSTPLLTTAAGNLTIDPVGDTIVRGSLSTGGSAALNIQNSSSTSILFARNDGQVGIGTATPTSYFHLIGANAGVSAAAIQTLQVTAGTGGAGATGAAGVAGGSAGSGSLLSFVGGAGGNGGLGGAGGASQAGGAGGAAATGGAINQTSGAGGIGGAGGAGGANAFGGNGAVGSVGSNITLTGGAGGAGGAGGLAGTLSTGGAGGNGANGGSLVLQGGAGGTGGAAGAVNGAGSTAGAAGTAGTFGAISLQANGGNVGIGTLSPSYKLDVQSGDINTSGVFRQGGTNIGQTASCSAGTALTGLAVSGGIITTSGTCSAVGGAATLQTTYDADPDGADVTISLTTADDSLILSNPATAGTDSAYIMRIEQLNTIGPADALIVTNSGTGNIVNFQDTGVSVFRIANGGGATFQNQTNSALGFTIQNAAANDILSVDTTTAQVLLGKSSSLTGKLVVKNATNANSVTIQSGTTATSYTLTLPTAVGAADQCIKTADAAGTLTFGSCGGASLNRVSLVPEFAGGTLTPDGSANSGTMTSDFVSGLTLAQGYKHTFYEWSTDQISPAQDYDIVVNYQLPSNFTSFVASSFRIWTYETSLTSTDVTFNIRDVDGTNCYAAPVSVKAATAATWEEKTPANPANGCTFAANDIITFIIKPTAISPATNKVRVGELRFEY